MKFIGQHIFDFIARFRNDVYLEDISTGTIASGGNLGLDANNKIVKADTEAGELTIANAADNRIVTSLGGTDLNAEATFTYNTIGGFSILDISSTSAGTMPFFTLTNTDTGAAGPGIEFVKSADGADDDTLGTIAFKGDDEAGNQQIYSVIDSEISDATAGQEAGRLSFQVAEFDGTLTEGLKIEGDTNADGEVDVTIGAGAASTTTIAGTLTMGSTAFANNSGVIQVATQGTIDHDSLANFVAAEHVDWASASAGTIHSTNIPTLNQNTTGQAGTVATITGLAPDTATTQATQPNITTMTGFLGGTANALITDDGDGTVTSESTLNYSLNKLTVSDVINGGKVSLGGTYSSGHPSAITNAVGSNILLDGFSVFTTAIPSMIKFNAASGATDQAAAYIEGAHANGTDKQGGDVIIVAGASTGNNASGSFKFWGDAGGGGSDSNVNAPTEKFSISGSGVVTTTNNIELGHASDTTIARSAAGTVTIEGNEIQTKNVHHHFLNAGFFLNFPFSRYIPLNGSISEQNTATFSPEYVNFTWPYDGFVKKMMLRTETDMGSTKLTLFKGASGALVTTELGTVTQVVDAADAIEFDFTSVSNAYSKGDTMAVRIDPTDDPDGGQNITIELVFDLTT